jgi:magnesium transporter
MISIDQCDGRVTEGGLPPERIGEFLKTASGGAQRRPIKSKPDAASRPMLWVDVNAPTDEDWKALSEQFDFHPLAMEDAQKQNQRPKVDAYDGYLFLSVRAWAGGDDQETVTREIDVFLGPDYLVTIHDEVNGPIQETRRRLQQNPEHLRSEPGFLLYLLLDALVDEYFPAMDALDTEIDEVEMAIYESVEAPDFKPAVRLKKRLLLLRQAVSPLRDVLNELLRTDDPSLISPETRVFYQDVYDHTLRLVEQVDLHRDIMGGVMDVLMSQTSNRLNQVMKTLTSISTILMSAALIAGIYGMNFKNMPELEWRYGYFLSLGLMVALATALALYFRKIKWF